MTNSTIESCPACKGVVNRFLFPWKGTAIHRCLQCGTEFSKRRFSDEELVSFYSESYFHGDVGYADYDAVEAMKQLTFRDRLDRLARSFPGRGRLLDVGCATGTMVKEALRQGWDAHGIDISAFAVAQGRLQDGGRLKERLMVETIQNCSHPDRSFDVLTLSDMIEHVHAPADILRVARRLLRSNGLLFVETPNVSGLMRRLMGSRWPMYRPPEHLVYFTLKSLNILLASEGFVPLNSKPSRKALTWNYVMSKLAVGERFWSLLQLPLVGEVPFWIPAGSFWTIARVGAETRRTHPGTSV